MHSSVAKGYSQKPGVDYEAIFSPVARLETVRFLLAIAVHNGWPVHHFDVKSTFLNGNIQEEVFVVQPEGYIVTRKVDNVYKLKKALYGLKQSPRAWYSRLDSHFREKNFIRSQCEHTLYRKCLNNGDRLLLSVYVDDIVYTSSSGDLIHQFKAEMKRTFDMSDLGELSFFLGLKVKQLTDGIHVRQKSYIEALLQKLNMKNCKYAQTPMSVNTQAVEEEGLCDPKLYQSLIGKLIYLTHSRPDICFSVSYLSRFMSCPLNSHLSAAKRILRYLAGTMELGLWFSRNDENLMDNS